MKRPSYVLRLLAVFGIITMMFAGLTSTALADFPPSGSEEARWDGTTNCFRRFGPIESDQAGDAFEDGANEVYFAAVGNGNDFGLGAAQTSITVQNIDVQDAYIFIIVPGEGMVENAYLSAGASKTFTARDLGIAEGRVSPVYVLGFNSLEEEDGDCVADRAFLAGVAKQAVTGNNLPYTTSADTSVSGYNAVSGREVGFFDQLYFPIVQTNCGPGGCWNTILRIANVGADSNAAVTVRFFPSDDGSGSLQTGFQLQALLNVGEVWNIDLMEWVPEGWVGSAQVFTDDAIVGIADRFKVGTDMWITNTASNAAAENFWQEPVPGAPQGAPFVLFAPDVRLDFNGWNTGINVANTVEADNTVNIQYFGNNGNAPQGQNATLAAQGMTYFYEPSNPSEDDCEQPANQPVTCDFVGAAMILSEFPVAAVVDGVKYFGNDANVGQAFSYSATGNVFEFQAAPLIQKGSASTGMGDTSGINFLNPNAQATFVQVEWINPSGFAGNTLGDTVVFVPGYSTGFVYTMFQQNLPNGFLGSAIVLSDLPIAATSANVNYEVQGDGTFVYNLYNPCGFFRFLGDCEVAVEPDPPATKVLDTNVEGAVVCIFEQQIDQDGKPIEPDGECNIGQVFEKGGEPGQGDADNFGAILDGDEASGTASISLNEGNNRFTADVMIHGLEAMAGQDVNVGIFGGDGNAICDPNDGTVDMTDPSMTENDFFGSELLSLGSGSVGTNGHVDVSRNRTLTNDEVSGLGTLEDAVVVAFDDDGNVLACGQIESGEFRDETNEEAAERLGAVMVVQTDGDGDVEVTLPAGAYFAVISAEGFFTMIETFELDPGETEVNEVNLEEDNTVPPPPPGDTVKVLDTNVEDALVCVFDQLVGQDGKPIEPSGECFLPLIFEKGAGGGGQGELDTFAAVDANDGDDVNEGANIEVDEENNSVNIDVLLTDLMEGDEITFTISGFFDDENTDGTDEGQQNATCDDRGETIITFESGSIQNEGSVRFSGSGDIEAGDFEEFNESPEEFVFVARNQDGETVFCAQLQEGMLREATLEEAAEILGAVVVVRTDADGDVEIPLEPGCYFAIITAEGFESMIETFCLEEGETEVNEVNLTEIPAEEIEGTLTKRLTFGDTFGNDDSGQPIESGTDIGARIRSGEITLQSTVVFCEGDITDESDCDEQDDPAVVAFGGYEDSMDNNDESDDFTFSAELDPGEYTICSTVTISGDFDGDPNTPDEMISDDMMTNGSNGDLNCEGTFEVEADEETVVINDFSEEAFGSLDIFVREDDSGAPIENAIVCLFEDEGMTERIECEVTGQDGIARFRVQSGIYTSNARAFGFESEASTFVYSIFDNEPGVIDNDDDLERNGLVDDEMTADVEQSLDLDVDPVNQAILDVTVTENGEELEGARVAVFLGDNCADEGELARVDRTDADGESDFIVEGNMEYCVRVTADPEDENSQTETQQVFINIGDPAGDDDVTVEFTTNQ